jgi:hypothetical protein
MGYNKAERLVLLNLNSQQADAFQRKNVTGFLELKRSNKGHSLLGERGMWTKRSVRRVLHPFNVVSKRRFEGVDEEIGSPNNTLTLILALSARPLHPDTRVKMNKDSKLLGPCSKFSAPLATAPHTCNRSSAE